jgi:thiol-disulfide isomerase/thioredoxin
LHLVWITILPLALSCRVQVGSSSPAPKPGRASPTTAKNVGAGEEAEAPGEGTAASEPAADAVTARPSGGDGTPETGDADPTDAAATTVGQPAAAATPSDKPSAPATTAKKPSAAAPAATDMAARPTKAAASKASAAPAATTKRGRAELPPPLNSKVVGTCGNDPGVGKKLKSFSLERPDGRPITSTSYRGRVLIVNFWGTWCKPCIKELPKFDRLYRRYRKHGLTLVAIATDDDADAVAEVVKSRKLRAKVAVGGESYAESFGADTYPFTFVVDGRGVIRASFFGYKPECLGAVEAAVRTELEKRNRR